MGLHQVYVGECVLHTWEGSVLCCCWVQTLQMSSGFGVIVLLRPSLSSPSVLFYSISCWDKVLVSNLCYGAFCPFLPHLFWRSGIRGMHIRFWFPFFKVLMNVSCFQYETSLFWSLPCLIWMLLHRDLLLIACVSGLLPSFFTLSVSFHLERPSCRPPVRVLPVYLVWQTMIGSLVRLHLM